METVWRNGRFVDSAGAVDATDRGFTLADGVFDTALVLGGRVFRRREHVARLLAALAVLDIKVPGEAIEAAMTALAERQGEGSIRVTVTRGPGPRGLKPPDHPVPTILGTSAPLSHSAMFAPMRLALSKVRRNETSPLSRMKALGYGDAVLGLLEAARVGADEALFLNTRGTLACSALANLFVVEGFELSTPPLRDGALPGILRGWVLENAEHHGLRPIERSMPPKALQTADALFLTNSLRLIAPAALSGPASEADLPEAVKSLAEGLCEAIAAGCGSDPRHFGAILPR